MKAIASFKNHGRSEISYMRIITINSSWYERSGNEGHSLLVNKLFKIVQAVLKPDISFYIRQSVFHIWRRCAGHYLSTATARNKAYISRKRAFGGWYLDSYCGQEFRHGGECHIWQPILKESVCCGLHEDNSSLASWIRQDDSWCYGGQPWRAMGCPPGELHLSSVSIRAS